MTALRNRQQPLLTQSLSRSGQNLRESTFHFMWILRNSKKNQVLATDCRLHSWWFKFQINTKLQMMIGS